MSMVERLAEQWVHMDLHPAREISVDAQSLDETRWWLNAIADELEYAYDQESDGCVATHLRTQAQKEA